MLKVQKSSLVDIVIDRMKAYVSENNLQPGDKFLTEKELVQKLEVSRTVVREAIISLQSIGILTAQQGGGIYIADSQLGGIRTILKHHYETYGVEVKELLEIRKILELGALRLIIENEIEVDFVRLTELNQSYKAGIYTAGDMKTLDAAFHKQLIKETSNESFFNLSNIINQYFSLTKIDLIIEEQEFLTAYEEHQRIISALQGKDLTTAQAIMTSHFQPVFKWIDQEGKMHNESN